MRADHFKPLIRSLDDLAPEQAKRVNALSDQRLRRANAVQVIEQAKPTGWCLHCGSEKVVRNGSNRGL